MLSYELGNPDRPRGHVLVYFRDLMNAGQVVASYIVVPPVQMDFAKYVPPMFAGQFDQFIAQGPSAFPLPPIPEAVSSLDYLRALASLRDDDLIDGGQLDVRDVGRAMAAVGDIAGEYTRAHLQAIEHLSEPTQPTEVHEALPQLDPDDILLDVLTDVEKVGRLAKLTGTLRYAVGGGDEALLSETVNTMRKVGQRLPEHYRIDALLQAAQSNGTGADDLVSLYVERCYRLAREELESIAILEQRIDALQARGSDR
ncbi:MAG: hypothetical protein ACKVVP_04925 [Chloroflexota bacterium]